MKTAELTGALLDLWVAKAEGFEILVSKSKSRAGLMVWDGYHGFPQSKWLLHDTAVSSYSPSTDWSIGGPIIERERIVLITSPINWNEGLREYTEVGFTAYINFYLRHGHDASGDFSGVGPTMLIAAMRAYVTSKFGEEVEL